jgi:hypothetical protein
VNWEARAKEMQKHRDERSDECVRLRKLLAERKAPEWAMRDHFATAALNGMLAGGAPLWENGLPGRDTMATWAYTLADAMLAAREKRGDS